MTPVAVRLELAPFDHQSNALATEPLQSNTLFALLRQNLSTGQKNNITVKPVLSGHSKIDETKILMTNGSLMKVESISECSKGSILQYF